MRYIIDGNNFLGAIGRDRSPENIEYLFDELHAAVKKFEYVVVFDGSQPPHYIDPHDITVIWQDKFIDTDGDDTLTRFVTKYGSRTQDVVVTQDKMLHARAIDFVSKVITPQDFIHQLSKNTQQDFVYEEKGEEYEGVDSDSITEELREVWRKKL